MSAVQTHVLHEATRGKIAIWWFLASEIMLFGALITSFVLSRLGGGPAATHEHLNVTVAAVNTVVLLTSSYTMVEAFAAAEQGSAARMRLFLGLTVLAGLAFLGFKAYEYRGEIVHGFTPATSGFWSFYYTMTGLPRSTCWSVSWRMPGSSCWGRVRRRDRTASSWPGSTGISWTSCGSSSSPSSISREEASC